MPSLTLLIFGALWLLAGAAGTLWRIRRQHATRELQIADGTIWLAVILGPITLFLTGVQFALEHFLRRRR